MLGVFLLDLIALQHRSLYTLLSTVADRALQWQLNVIKLPVISPQFSVVSLESHTGNC